MKCVPMIFNSEMVCALLEGRKTVTRRPLKIKPEWHFEKIGKITSSHPKKGSWGAFVRKGAGTDFPETDLIKAPCWIGDLIWVRETFTPAGDGFIYSAELDVLEQVKVKWTPSIHMPREASRLTLKVTDVRIEQVQDITEEQAINEGVERIKRNPDFFHVYFPVGNKNGLRCSSSAITSFSGLWDVIYNNWDTNPYVWVIEFEVVNQNIDKYINGVNKCQ